MKFLFPFFIFSIFIVFSLKSKCKIKDFDCGELCSARPCVNVENYNCGSFFASASFIFWQTKQGNMAFAAKNEGAKESLNNLTTLNFELITPDFIWRAGAKAVLGYNLPIGGIDIQAKWTYLPAAFTHIKKNVFSTIDVTGQGIIPLWYYQFLRDVTTSPRYEHANGDWNMRFNTVDLEWGRASYLKPKVKLRTHAGIKIAWINQTYKVEYNRGNLITGPNGNNFQLISSNFVLKNNSAGIGPRLGVNSRWKLCWGFSLIGDGAFSLVYDYFRVSKDQNDLVFDNNLGQILPFTAVLSENFSKFQPVLEICLGIDWGTCFRICNRRNYFGLTISYDTQYWWSQNQMRRLVNSVSSGDTFINNGDLQPHGLTASARFDF
jgi:Legionella pneumophila major outer membrane protein precursor